MSYTSWKYAIVEWINCLGLVETLEEIRQLEDGVCFNKLLDKLEQSLVRSPSSIDDDELPDMQRVLLFLNSRYPFLPIDETAVAEENVLIMISSILIYHCCIKCTDPWIMSMMCDRLPSNVQICIAKFLEKLVKDGMSMESLQDAINFVAEKCTNTHEESVFTSSPDNGSLSVHKGRSSLREFFESPAAQRNVSSAWNPELNRLQVQLDDELYEKNVLQAELNEAKKKIEELEKRYLKKVQETLNVTVFSESFTDKSNEDELIREKELLKKEKLFYESYCDKLEKDISNLEAEKEAVTIQLRASEEDKIIWQQKFEELSVLFEDYEKNLQLKEVEVSYLKEQCNELGDCIQALREERSPKWQTDSSNISGYGEDLGQGVIDLLIQEKQEENEKLKLDLNAVQEEKMLLQEQLSSLTEEFRNLEVLKEKMSVEITNLTNLKSDMEKEDSRKTNLIEEMVTEVKLLKSTVTNKEMQCDALHSDIEETKRSLNCARYKLHETEQILASKLEIISKLNTENDEINCVLKQLKETNKMYESDLRTLNNKVSVKQKGLCENIKTLMMVICEIPDFYFIGYDSLEVTYCDDVNDVLKSLFNYLIYRSLNLSAKYSALQGLYEGNKNQLEWLKEEKKAIIREKEYLTNELSVLQNENSSLSDIIKMNTEKIINLQKTINDKEVLIKQLNCEKDALVDDFEAKVNDLNAKVGIYESKLSDVCNQKFIIEGRYSKMKNDLEEIIKNLTEEVTALVSEKSSVEARFQDLSKQLTDASIEKLEIAEKLSAALEQTKKIPILSSEIEVLKDQLQEFGKTKVELACERNKIENLQKEYDNLSIVKESLESNLGYYKNEVSVKTEEIMKLNRNISKYLSEMLDLKSNIEDTKRHQELISTEMNQKFEQVNTIMDTLRCENNDCKSLIHHYDFNLDQLFSLCQNISENNTNFEISLDGKDSKKFVMIKDCIKDLKANLDKTVKDHELQQEFCGELNKQIKSLKLRQQDLLNNNETLEIKTKESEKTICELQDLLKIQTNKCLEVQNDVEEQSREIFELKKNKELEIFNLNVEKEQLQSSLVELEEKEKVLKKSFEKDIHELKERIKSVTCDLISITERKKHLDIDLSVKEKECEELKFQLQEVEVVKTELSSKLISINEDRNSLLHHYESNLDQLFSLCHNISENNTNFETSLDGKDSKKFVMIKDCIEHLKANLDKTVEDHGLQQKFCEELNKQIKSLELREQDLLNNNETLEIKTKESEKTICELQELLKIQTNECLEVQHVIEEQSREIFELKKNKELEIFNLNVEKEQLQSSLEKLEEKEKVLKKSFEKDTDELKDRIKSITCDLVSITERKKQLDIDLSVKEKECAELKFQLREVEVAKTELSSKLMSISEDRNSLLHRYESNLDQLFSLCQNMCEKNLDFETSLDGKDSKKFVMIKDCIKHLKANLDKIVEDHELQQKFCEELNKQIKSLELREQDLLNSNKTLEIKTKELEKTISELQELLKIQTNKCLEVQHDIEEQSREIFEIKKNKELEIFNLNAEKEKLQSYLVELEEKEKVSKKSFEKDTDELKERMKSITCDLISITERKKHLDINLSAKQKECEELKSQLQDIKLKNSKLSSKLISVGEEKSQLMEKLGVETTCANNLINEKNAILAMKNVLQDKVKELERELYKMKYKAGKEMAQQLEQLSANYDKVCKELADEKTKLAVALKERQDENNKARKVIEELELQFSEIDKNVKSLYEGKLLRTRERMKTYFDSKLEQVKSTAESETAKYYEDKIKNYEKDLADYQAQMWDLRDSLLKVKEEKQAVERKLLEEVAKNKDIGKSVEIKSADDCVFDVNETYTLTRRRSVFRRFPSDMDKFLHEEDEQGETFSETYLADLKEGRCNPKSLMDPRKRISELQYRNSLCPPHLKSSYPAETNFYDPKSVKDEDIKLGTCSIEAFDYDNFDTLSTSQLIPAEKRKRDRGQTAFKKPGPPTPCKNANVTFNISGTPRSALKDCNNENVQKKRRTPSRIKALFGNRSGQHDENTPMTPRRRRSIFKKISKNQTNPKYNL